MPFTIFSHRDAAEDAHRILKELGATMSGDENKWAAEFTFKEGLFRKKKALTFTHDKEWCSPPNWPKQLSGMENYVGNFSMDDAMRSKVSAMIRSFRITIGIITNPSDDNLDEHRLELMQSVASKVNGIFFTPGALLDSNFRTLVGGDGSSDHDAVFPDFPQDAVDMTMDIASPPAEQATDEDEEIEYTPPTAGRVAERLVCMLGVAARGLLDMNLSRGLEASYSHDELLAWIEKCGIAEEFELAEREIINTPIRELGQQDVINSVWCLEGAAVLAWALGLNPLPDYDAVVDTDELLERIGFLRPEATRAIVDEAALTSPNSLEIYNNQIFAFHWRMVDFRVRPKAVDFAKMEQECWFGPLDLSWASLIDKDLALNSQPISKADQNTIGMAQSIASERHRASNWLTGQSELYSETDTST